MAPIAPIDLAAERACVGKALDEAVLRVLHSGGYILGPEVEGFERAFARYQRTERGFGVASGTDALILALKAAGVKPGDHVLTSPFTFFASAGTIEWIGARPVLCDVQADTALLDPVLAASAIDDKTTAILPVHLYGQLADLRAFKKLCDSRGLALIEDGAQAHGAERDGLRCGELGDVAAFSFYPTKNLGAAGDGGMVLTSNANVAEEMALLRDHGSPKKYEHASIGTNSRLAAMQAAVLATKLPFLDEWNARRRAIAARYDEAFEAAERIRPLQVAPDSAPVYHQYTIRIASEAGEPNLRDRIQKELADQEIFTGVHYPAPVHLQPAMAHLGYEAGSFPNAEALAQEVLCLPVHPFLADSDVQRVIDAILVAAG